LSAYADIVQTRTSRDLGVVIRAARREQGMTQAQLAAAVGVARSWVIAVERGKSTAEVGLVLRTLAVLGLVADVVAAPPPAGPIDLDDLLG
jgi:y4mF family transcriptional regulator